jgi:ABC-type multidrug transport system fused ATPase/permease subunit
MGLPDFVRKLAALLTPRAKRQLLALGAFAAIAGLLETAAVATIMPFLAMLAAPELLVTDPRLARLHTFLGSDSETRSIAYFGAFVLLVLVVANAFSSLTTWLMLRYANRQGHALSTRLLGSYLSKPYVFYLDRHTAELQKNVFGEVQRVTVGVLIPAVQIVAKLAVIIFIAALLLLVDPVVALVVAAVLGSAYAVLYQVARATLFRAGQVSVEAGTQRARYAIEALAGAKEIRLLGREAEFLRRFEAPSLTWADTQTAAQALGQLPRYAVETVAFGLILTLAIYLLGTGRSAGQILPLLGLYTFAGYRLMPALQQVFAGFASIRASHAALDAVLRDLPHAGETVEQNDRPVADRIPLAHAIELIDARYRYPGTNAWELQPVSLRIPKNSSVALVGATGCGKTTVVDLLMGLLRPTGGSLRVDGVVIDDGNLRAWQRSIGHVPQQIFLSDDTIARNIAFGLPDEEIDMSRVKQAASLARLDEFVSGLPKGYGTMVGERGIRLSGGQRQRIGIARALYPDPELIVFDEATSALDSVTENAVLEALQALAGRKTIVMVAHRLSTVRGCDLICVMEQGRIVEQGRFEELMGSSQRFRGLSAVTSGLHS